MKANIAVTTVPGRSRHRLDGCEEGQVFSTETECQG